MILIRRTNKTWSDRRQLVITRKGLDAQYWRAQVGGGFYLRSHVFIPWRRS